MARSLNQVQLIGNLTRDPEIKYTPQGTAVCTFTIATNRAWKTESGEDKEEADFHRLVAWRQLAEICAKLLKKGAKVYVSGRLSTRSWDDASGQKKYMTEVVVSDMIMLGAGSGGGETQTGNASPDNFDDIPADFADEFKEEAKDTKVKTKEKPAKNQKEEDEEDIPF